MMAAARRAPKWIVPLIDASWASAIDELVDVARRDLDLEAAWRPRRQASPVAGMRSLIVRSALRPVPVERRAREKPAVHLLVEREADAVRQLRVQERPRAADSCGSRGPRRASTCNRSRTRASPGVECRMPRSAPFNRSSRGRDDAGDVLADQEIVVHLADLVVERREVVQLEMVLQ